MKPHLTIVTLGVADLQTALEFYRDTLGWPAKAEGDIVFISLNNGVVLSLFGREALAKDATVSSKGSGFSGFTLAHNVGSADEVDAIFATLAKVGVTVVKQPQKTDWGGYSGYFSDPDGYLWEVAYNPFSNVNEDGSLEISR